MRVLTLFTQLLLLVINNCNCIAMELPEVTLYVGSYTTEIVRISLAVNGDMKYISKSLSEPNPSWLTFNSGGNVLFAVSEVETYANPYYEYTGAVSSFSVNDDGGLSIISTVASGGASPAHVTTDSSESALYISNYCSGECFILILVAPL